jgi:hypothetical protein
VNLSLQRAQGISFAYSPGQISASRPLGNVTTTLNLPGDRWLLWAQGPSWGPAVLFWGYLIVVLLAAFGLSRVPHTPLKTHEWVLLGLGLTQVEVAVVFFVLAWLFGLSYRERHAPSQRWAFNATQVGLALLTLIALICLAEAVHQGLVVRPDMQVQGQDSSNELLHWYSDRSSGAIPMVRMWSVPIWIYKGLMLAWALWLAASLLRWLRWGWTASHQGGVWRSGPPTPGAPTPTPAPRHEPEPATAPPRGAATQTAPGENPRVPLDQIARAQAELDAARKLEAERASEAARAERKPDEDA